MNEDEQKTATEILKSIRSAAASDVVQFSTAYQALTQGAVNRSNAEILKMSLTQTK